MDHGMFGWSLYIEQLQQCVDLFPLTNSYTGEEIKDKDLIRKMFYYEYYFDKAKDTPYNTTGIFPPYVNHVKNNKAYKTNDEMFNIIDKTCKQEGKQFIYCYFGEPDSTMHRFGVNSKQAKKIISYIDEKIQQLYKNNPQTLFIITPDHGQTDITDYIELYKDTELLKTLKTPLYLEARAVSFNLLDGKDKDFKKQMKKYKNIKLYKVEKLIKSNYFGKPTHNAKLLGDYIGVVKDNKTQLLLSPKMVKFKGHHTGLSKREMLLPLIIIG